MRRALIALAIVATPSLASAEWRRLKVQLKPAVTVVRETDDVLVVRAPGSRRDVVIRSEKADPCDIYRRMVFRRGGNPYEVWLATSSFARNTELPRRRWGELFHTSFLRILRVPEAP